MFNKVLVANRGEIAVRIIRTLKEMGITAVSVYSEVDRDSLHVKLADESYCIGPASASRSYLNIPGLVSVAEVTGADAIHPGYGFLAEDTHFAEVCESSGIKFIGPTSETISMMGDKVRARELMVESGVPVVPGDEDGLENIEIAQKKAKEIGYPVIIKAVAGGGGKGMRIVKSPDMLKNAIQVASSEAKAAFENGKVYMEKYLEKPRHIEFQILADEHGNIIHLGERDCSIQRRHQKVIEESPSPALTADQREEMGKTAIKAARAADYTNAGTVEFLLDSNDNYYFIEMNTRIQVEHPVTEFVTGIDLIREQIRIAAGEKLNCTQQDIEFKGAALECRINAEDPDNKFRPSPGRIDNLIIPGGPGVRFDSGIYPGYNISPYYDSMVAKLIVWDLDRESALNKMKRALEELKITGIITNINFHQTILNNDSFRKGEFYTDFIEEHLNY